MTLKFIDQAALYNPHTNNVKFYGEDGETKVLFAISRELLAALEKVKTLDEKSAVKAFARHRNRIRVAAEKAYLEIGAGSDHAYEVAAKHFDIELNQTEPPSPETEVIAASAA